MYARSCEKCGMEYHASPEIPLSTCPVCEEKGEDEPRTVQPSGSSHGTSSATATLSVIRHWDRLLENAERLHASGEYAVTVVVAQTACEVIAERAIADAFTTQGVPALERPVADLIFTHNLGNKKVRKLYSALTGDDTIAVQPFWEPFKRLVDVRNDSVHSGKDVSEADSRSGLDAARDLIEHVRINALRPEWH